MLRHIYGYWDEKRAGRSMPFRRDIDPTEIKELLPHLMIVEPTGEDAEERRYRYRLVGSALVDAFGFNFVGTCVGATTTPSYRRLLLDIYGMAFGLKRPVYSRMSFLAPEKAPQEANRLLLPLSNDGLSVHQVLTLHLFVYRHRQREPAAPEMLDVTDSVIEVL